MSSNGDSRKRSFWKDFGGNAMATITVGKEQKEFVIHRGLLCFYSGYFRGALNGSFAEAVEGKVSLPTEDSKIFEIFNAWLYTGNLEDRANVIGSKHTSIDLCRLWIFGDVHQIPRLQNQVMDVFFQQVHDEWLVPTSIIPSVFKHTTKHAKLRSALIDSFALTSSKGREFDLGHWTLESMTMLASRLLERPKFVGKADFKKLDLSPYYVEEKEDHSA